MSPTQPSKLRANGVGLKGFTLIELLLAIFIFAIVLAAINGVFFASMRLQRRTTEVVEAGLPLQRALAVMRRDLQGIMAPGGTSDGTSSGTPTRPLSGSLRSGVTSSSSATTSAGLRLQSSPEFYTCTGPLDEIAPWGEVQKVVYFLRQPFDRSARGMDLYRSSTRNLLTTTMEESMDEWLMGGVDQLLFSFFDGSQWLDTWDSTGEVAGTSVSTGNTIRSGATLSGSSASATTTNTTTTVGLPKAIKVEIVMASAGGGRQARSSVQMVAPVMTQVPTYYTPQSATGGTQ